MSIHTSQRLAPPALALLLLALALCPAGCGDDGDDGTTAPIVRQPEDFLPTNVSGWESSAEVESGTTYEDLTASINGGANIYWRHNVKEFARGRYAGTGSNGGSADIRIYEMNSAADAAALYNDSELGYFADSQPALGDMAGQTSSMGFSTLWFTHDHYFIELLLESSDTQFSEDQALLLATGIDSQLAGL